MSSDKPLGNWHQEWHSPQQELPATGIKVLLCVGIDYAIGELSKTHPLIKTQHFYLHGWDKFIGLEHITGWQHLPALPENTPTQ